MTSFFLALYDFLMSFAVCHHGTITVRIATAQHSDAPSHSVCNEDTGTDTHVLLREHTRTSLLISNTRFEQTQAHANVWKQ